MQDSIALFLMTEKGYRVLDAITQRFPGSVERVIGARDAGIGNDFYDEILALCDARGIAFRDRDDGEAIDSDYSLTVSWRWMIDCPNSSLIVLHDSLLPRYRGFSPLVSALVNGEPEIGVTALFASEQYDRGDIIAQSSRSIEYPMKISEAIDLTIECYLELALDIVGKIVSGTPIVGTAQSEALATYSLWRDEDDYAMEWHRSAEYLQRFVDAVGHPYRGALTMIGGRRARIREAVTIDDVVVENRTPGKIIFMDGGQPVVVCGSGLLRLIDVVDDETNESLLPLRRFRVKLG